jgi:hypothetical protein
MNIFEKKIDIGPISFQELQYLLYAIYETKRNDPDLGKVQDRMIERLSKLELDSLPKANA